MKRRWLLFALFNLLVFFSPLAARADLPYLSRTVTLTNASQQAQFSTALSGQGACAVTISSNALSEDVNVLVSVDGTHFVPADVADYAGGTPTTAINSGTYHGDCSAAKQFRVALASPSSSSSVTLTIAAGQSSPSGGGGGSGSSYTFAEPLVNTDGAVSFDYGYDGVFTGQQEFDAGAWFRGAAAEVSQPSDTSQACVSGGNDQGLILDVNASGTTPVALLCMDTTTSNLLFAVSPNGSTYNTFEFPSGGLASNSPLCTDNAAPPVITTTGCSSGSGMPVYTHTGGAQSTAHCVMDSFTASGSTATITLSGSAVFTDVTAAWGVNQTTHVLVPVANISTVQPGSIGFSSITTGDLYGYTVCGY